MNCPEPPIIIRTDGALRELVQTLKQQNVVAFDMESNGLHAYREQVCLLQCSIMNAETVVDYVVDPLAIQDMQPLGEIFADPAITIVFHASEYDIVSLKRDYGYQFTALFDTYMAVRTLGWPKVGLRSVLEHSFGVKLDKKYQQADWSKRPLSDEQLCYAQLDTHYLIKLRKQLVQDLEAQNLVVEAQEYFDALCALPAAETIFDPDGFWKIRDARYLSDEVATILRELYLWREKRAESWDLPPFKIMGDSELLAIAKANPRSVRAMYQIKRVSKKHIERYGRQLMSTIKRAQHRKPPKKPENHVRPTDDVLTRFDALREWRKHRADQRGVESDIIISKQALWDLAYQCPTTWHELETLDSIWPYRRQKYGEEILAVLARVEG